MPDFSLIKMVSSGLALLLTFYLFWPYIRSIQQGKTVPHFFSWVIWALGTFIVFLAQVVDGAGVGAWPIGLSGLLTIYVAWLAYRVRSAFDISGLDRVLFILALLATPAWLVSADPLMAVILLTVADLLGFGPTLRKAWHFPYQEHAGFFAMGAVRNTFVVIALEHYSWTTVLFPAAVGAACLLVSGFIVLCRWRSTAQSHN